MLEGLPAKRSWNGRHFFAEASKERGDEVHALAQAERGGHRLLGERVERPPRTLPAGVGESRASAVVAGASTGIWRTGLISRIVGSRRESKARCLRQRESTDTSPPNGCRMATTVAIGELAQIEEASVFSLTVVPVVQPMVPEGELVDFMG